MNKSLLYLKLSAGTFVKRPSLQTLASICRDYRNWTQYLDKERNPVTDQLPWVSFAAIRYLRSNIRPTMQVFEYGSGGSTLFWAKNTSKVASVEHDLGWYNMMKHELTNLRVSNVEYILAQATDDLQPGLKNPGLPDDYVSSDPQFQGKSFELYVRTIDQYPNEFFDIIMVDGRARPSCIKHSVPKLKKNGWLVIDNSERDYYLKAFSFDSPNWEIRKFAGPVPYVLNFSETTVLKKMD